MNATSCAIVQDVYRPFSSVVVVLIAEGLLGFLALLASLVMTIMLYATRVFKFNCRIVLICLALGAVTANIGVLLRSAFFSYVVFTQLPTKLCSWLMLGNRECFTLNNTYLTGCLVLLISPVLLSIERLFDTFFASEGAKPKKFVGISMAMFAAFLTVGASIFNTLWTVSHRSLGSAPYADGLCPADLFTGGKQSIFYVFLLFHFCSLLIFVVLWLHNNSNMVQKHIAMASSHFLDNVVETEMTFPVVVLGSIFLIGHFIIDYGHLKKIDEVFTTQTHIDVHLRDDPTSIFMWSELQVCLAPVFSLLISRTVLRCLPPVFSWRNTESVVPQRFSSGSTIEKC
ncbi:hypothetical protein QR680_018233 [Steinernema hermaphroditum]|uniref:Uncharacterized protein n=1 Tax=Steinernema hermaphroditum TaxID=289476 RepID=A0AA39HHA1_9BILA|nr:hypothetical protein QR680_018233 [Steinernema hermaphroditum]